MSAQAIDSIIRLARAILKADALETHKRKLLNICIWQATEVNGKYAVRYWSAGVWELVQQHGSLSAVRKLRPMPIRHEHINTRKSLIDAMLRDPACAERVLREDAIACLVTIAEHRQLSDAQTGFARYTAAGIRVWDVQEQRWLDKM